MVLGSLATVNGRAEVVPATQNAEKMLTTPAIAPPSCVAPSKNVLPHVARRVRTRPGRPTGLRGTPSNRYHLPTVSFAQFAVSELAS
jgi:hypothetical protein